MQIFSFALVVLLVVLASSLVDERLSRLSLPLIQIGAGLAAGILFPTLSTIAAGMDPNLFLVLFIAPLLFDESRSLSKRALARQWGPVLALAVGLVAVTTFVVGFLLHGLAPSIPLGAALALGAALGPTDAVSVAALEGEVELDEHESSLLNAEALLNDATGLVGFQFAVAFLAAGSVSAPAVAVSFLAAFFGGAALGVAVGLLAGWAVRLLHRNASTPPAFYAILDLMLPFAVFLLGNAFGVSGVIAVVGAGIAMTLAPGPKTVSTARVERLTKDLWEILVFALNGAVFVLLGLQLPMAIVPSWTGPVDSWVMVGLMLAVAAAVIGTRFVWLLAQQGALRKKSGDDNGRPVRSALVSTLAGTKGAIGGREPSPAGPGACHPVRSALVSTLAGTKGAITLSIAMTLPRFVVGDAALPDRGTLIFIASGVILITLLLANFVLPLLAPAETSPDADLAHAECLVLSQLILRLDEGIQLNEDDANMARALAITQRTYEHRRERLRMREMTGRERRRHERELRAQGSGRSRFWKRRDRLDDFVNADDDELETMCDLVAECEARSLHIELDVIRDLAIEGAITPEQSRALREKVYVMQMTLVG
ncbi:sodium:proton antiporter [Olsenella sp. YH-ols2217]|uniref:Sodium:proton antiporter n=1 Tax=Kribbibacterium absianum TaxID=3044210 RepID=A0ABT6ZLQ8_9ACTN|nr:MULTISPECIES: sodium:proton antiporter [unclassified Olsenella]MDJ1121736.1 sodium:proton antiporter [Olsenella sp. YH-ols2216]MDJ1129744.1 sodium:proton antiporter [Olsenella sp. YH-ols2217]